MSLGAWRSISDRLLALLDELRPVIGAGRQLSVAAYPPPTWMHPHPEVHWQAEYFRAVAERVDQIVPMLYDTGITREKLYVDLVRRWTGEVLDWSGRSEVLLGIPAYDDAGVGYHDPAVENPANAMAGIFAAVNHRDELTRLSGIAIYAEWTLTPADAAWLAEVMVGE